MAVSAVQPLNIAQVNPVLQEYIDKTVTQVFEEEADFLKMLKQETEDKPTNYRGRRIPIKLTRNPSLAASSPNGGILATPGAHTNNYLTVTYQWLHSGFEQTYEAILNNAQNPVTDQTREGIDSTISTLTYWANCYASNGDGTMRLALTTAAYDGTNSTTKKTCATSGAVDGLGATQLVVGQKILFFDPTGATQRTGTVGNGALTIATISKTGFTTTTDMPSDVALGDIVVPEGTAASATAIKGVPFLAATTSGSYFGTSKTTYPQLAPTTTAAGGAVTAALLLNLHGKMRNRMGANPNYTVAMSSAQHYAYTNLVGASTTPQYYLHDSNTRPQYDIGGKNIDELSFWGKPIKFFIRLRADQLYFLNMKAIKVAMLKKIGRILDMPAADGLQMIDSNGNYLAATQKWFDTAFDIYSADPRQLGAMTGLTWSGAPALVS